MEEKQLKLKYHPIKEEIQFYTNDSGAFIKVKYTDNPVLEKYSPNRGDFLLQNQGSEFFDDIKKVFLNMNNRKIVFEGTKLDYEDFARMVDAYNTKKNKNEKINLGEFIELTDVDTMYGLIHDFYNQTMLTFDKEFQDSVMKTDFEQEKVRTKKKIGELEKNHINLCMVGAYSAGKSTFINALLGEKVLPEALQSKTAKMFKISNESNTYIAFNVKKDIDDNGEKVYVYWDPDKKEFLFSQAVNDDVIKGKLDEELNKNKQESKFIQLRKILEILNEIPNNYEEGKSYIDGIIEIGYPIPLCDNLNFTFFDTPGTDSNSEEHFEVLEEALKQQTNSILIILYEGKKIEGSGNKILYKLIKKLQSEENKNDDITIDLSRSLHVINQVDTLSTKQMEEAKSLVYDKGITISSGEDVTNYTLKNQRTFYVSSKGAYCAQAYLKGICDDDDKEFIDEDKDKIIKKKYYQHDKLAYSEMETTELKEKSDQALEECEMLEGIEKESRQLYICSGMYAIEQEIKNYAEKYALAVKAKGLYDAVRHVINAAEDGYRRIENQSKRDKEELSKDIEILKGSILVDIKETCNKAIESVTIESMRRVLVEQGMESESVEQSEKMKKYLLKNVKGRFSEDKFNDDQEKVAEEFKRRIRLFDDHYINARNRILKNQVEYLKEKISKIIEGYQDIDDELIKKILSVPEISFPPAQLNKVKRDNYKKIFIAISRVDKKAYIKRVETEFMSKMGNRKKEYVDSIKEDMKTVCKKLEGVFIENINTLSTELENLIEKRSETQKVLDNAKKAIEMVQEKRAELDKKIWSKANE